VTVLSEFLNELNGRILACIGDAEGREAVSNGTGLELTRGQVCLLDEVRQLLAVAIVAEQRASAGRQRNE
jgi:hypothetical protein